MWIAEFYKRENGEKPVKEFLDGLDTKLRAKAVRDIEILCRYGKDLREPYSKYMQDGIYELRTKQSTNITRILYFFYVNNKIILTNGFIKKTQKTPPSEIERAIKYKKDFERREQK